MRGKAISLLIGVLCLLMAAGWGLGAGFRSSPAQVKGLIAEKRSEIDRLQRGERGVNGFAECGLQCPKELLKGDPVLDQYFDANARVRVLREQIKALQLLLSQLTTPAIPGPLEGSFIGCFKDTADRDLAGAFVSSPTMTIQTCLARCRDGGFAFAGLQYGSQCFCGNRYGRFGRASNCDMKCSGDPSQICGGFWANSIYAVGIYNTADSGENFMPGVLTYREPRIDGYRLDWCRVWAGDCGKGAADAFCRLHGHARAVEWEMDPDIGLRSPTKVIATGQICNEGFCDGFKFIKCEAATPASPGTGPVQLEAEIKGRSYMDRVGPGEGLGGNGSPDYLVQARVSAPGKVLVRWS